MEVFFVAPKVQAKKSTHSRPFTCCTCRFNSDNLSDTYHYIKPSREKKLTTLLDTLLELKIQLFAICVRPASHGTFHVCLVFVNHLRVKNVVYKLLSQICFTRKYLLRRYVPSPSGAAKEDNVEEKENSEVKQIFRKAE